MIRKVKTLIPKVDPYTNKAPKWKPLSVSKDLTQGKKGIHVCVFDKRKPAMVDGQPSKVVR
jgi:hypothetical protein